MCELEDFWKTKKRKIWVVYLDNNNRKNPVTDKKIVSARNKSGALQAAKNNSVIFRSREAFGSARLADPELDLGCVKSHPPTAGEVTK